jgi:hypothetical protein
MLYLVRLSNAYGSDIIIKHFETKPAARGFRIRLNKLLESDDTYIDEIAEDEKCLGCGKYRVDILRAGVLHDCELRGD